MEQTEDIKVRIVKVRKTYSDGTVAMKVEAGLRQFTACGVFPFEGSPEDFDCTLTGHWYFDKRNGKQFRFTECRMGDNELFHMLIAQIKGVSKTMARLILEKFPPDKLPDIIENAPEKLLDIRGIKKQKLVAIQHFWEIHRPLQELANYLAPLGFNTKTARRIFNCLGKEALGIIKANPYRAIDADGIDFAMVDDIARKMGFSHKAKERIKGAAVYLLGSIATSRGDTIVRPEQFLDEMLGLLNREQARALGKKDLDPLWELVAEKTLKVHDGDWFCLQKLHVNELRIKAIIGWRSRLETAPLLTPRKLAAFIEEQERFIGKKLADRQREAVEMVGAGHRTLVICGYAGTGKTTVAKVLLNLLAKSFTRDEFICVALSGIAAERIGQVTGYRSSTIHTFLGYKEDGSYVYDYGTKTPYRVILIDEASMINNELFSRVLDTTRDDATLIILGDDAQLPPIGAGNAFSDIVRHRKVPTVVLDKIHRQSEHSVIVTFAEHIRKGEVPPHYKKGRYADFAFLETIHGGWSRAGDLLEREIEELAVKNNAATLAALTATVRELAAACEHPVFNIQVLTPVKDGFFGTDNLNAMVQGILNPAEDEYYEHYGVKYKVGDKVVHLRNRNMDVIMKDDIFCEAPLAAATKERVYNGSVGSITRIDHDMEQIFVEYRNKVVIYDFIQAGDIFDLAYCLTIHKSQGNEYKYVIIPISHEHSHMLNRQLLYTAITRAYHKVVFMGSGPCFEKAIKQVRGVTRKTVLSVDWYDRQADMRAPTQLHLQLEQDAAPPF